MLKISCSVSSGDYLAVPDHLDSDGDLTVVCKSREPSAGVLLTRQQIEELRDHLTKVLDSEVRE